MTFFNLQITQTKMVIGVVALVWLGHLHPQKTLYRAKHAFGAFTIVETTNAISPVITLILSPQ
jgi:hypothetical protein